MSFAMVSDFINEFMRRTPEEYVQFSDGYTTRYNTYLFYPELCLEETHGKIICKFKVYRK